MILVSLFIKYTCTCMTLLLIFVLNRYVYIYYNEDHSRLQMYFIALSLQLCFVWPKDDHTLQAILAKSNSSPILPEECGHPLTIRNRAVVNKAMKYI